MKFVGAPATLEGNSKKNFQNNVKRYAEFHKEGYKIVIDQIKDTVDPAISVRGSKYQKFTVNLLKSILKNEESPDFSVMKLAELMGCINENYRDAYKHRRKLVKELNIDKDVADDFFNATHSKIKYIVETALDKLVGAGLIEYHIRLKGIRAIGRVEIDLRYDESCDEDYVAGDAEISEGYQFLNEEEVAIYELEKQRLLEKYKVNAESELYSKHKNTTAFYSELNKNVFDKTHIRNIYRAYVITKKMDYEVGFEIEESMLMIHLNDIVATDLHLSADDKMKEKYEEIELYEDAVALGIVEDEEEIRRSNKWRLEQIEKNKAKDTLIDAYIKLNIEDE